jgi:hypothetical protein
MRVFGTAVVIVAGVLLSVGTLPASGTASAPRLGRPWGSYQIGYGQVRPKKIYNGGDGTGAVIDIHWTTWGGEQAIGYGRANYLSPTTREHVAATQVVAFNLGTCDGYKAYDAIEWYFPEYGDKFQGNTYINDCTGAYVMRPGKTVSCADVRVAGSDVVATAMLALNLSCAEARLVVRKTTPTDDTKAGQSFGLDRFQCDTDVFRPPTTSVFCQRGDAEFGFNATPSTWHG